MLYHLFSTLVTALFLIATHGQSHSAEPSSNSHMLETFSELTCKDEAIEFWKRRCLNPALNREVVRENFSNLTFDYHNLKDSSFDVLDIYDPPSAVFSKITLNLDMLKKDRKLNFASALAQSHIKSLTLRGNLTPELGEALVAVLKGKTCLQKLDMWSLKWEEFNPDDTSKYKMIKKIGLAATGVLDELFIDLIYSTKAKPFDFKSYDPEKEFRKLSPDRKIKNKMTTTHMEEKSTEKLDLIPETSLGEEKIKMQQEAFDERVLNCMVYSGLIFISVITVYSPILSAFICTILMILLAIPLA